MKSFKRPSSASSKSIATPSRRSSVDGTAPSVAIRGRAPQTVHKKELDQLSSFIRKRNHDLDEEISSMRDKLRSSSQDRPLESGLKGLYRSKSIENDSLNHVAENPDMRLQGKALGKVELQPNKVMQESRLAAPQLTAATKVFETRKAHQTNTDQLVTLLAKIKLKAEDAGMSGSELRDLLLTPDLSISGEYLVPIEEVTDVFQTDLLLPLTKPDQRLMVEEYGDERGLINVQNLLLDAGLWDDDGFMSHSELLQSPPYHDDGLLPPPSPLQPSRYSNTYNNSNDFALTSNTATSNTAKNRHLSSPYRTLRSDANNSPTKSFRERTTLQNTEKTMLESNRNLEELQNLHDLIMQDADFDDADHAKELKQSRLQNDSWMLEAVNGNGNKEEKSPSTPVNTNHANSMRMDPEIDQQYAKTNSSTNNAQRNSIDMTDYENKKIKHLAEENLKLKEELRAFDGNFFEQLEDLKFRYSRLQEVLGEDPLARATVNKLQDSSNMPLGKLAWSVRRSMTAIDRASYDSPLVAGPRAAHAYTYTPGNTSNYPIEGIHHVGGSLSATAEKKKAADLDSSARNTFYSAREGGVHGIGAGTYIKGESDMGGSFANLCERRLAFELSQSPRPDDAILTLINRIIECGDRNKALDLKKGESVTTGRFITVPQLEQCFYEINLNFSAKEVEVLASGFASNGKGGIDCDELCNMIQSMAYNLLGHYSRTYLGNPINRNERANGRDTYRRRKGAEESDDLANEKDFKTALRELCEIIITYDKRGVLGSSTNLAQTLLKPFVELDIRGGGWLCFGDLKQVLKELGAMLSADEYTTLARPFVLSELPAPSAYPENNLNHIDSFRDRKLTGSLVGTTKSTERFGDFLSSHGLNDLVKGDRNQSLKSIIAEETPIDYVSFVDALSRMLGQMIDEKGGLPMIPKLPWVLKEFDFIDILLSQLESMKSTTRRKTLITLQYALENADSRDLGELDGFAILTALINCGFRLQRYERVQLLRAAEEYGGLLEYSRLVLILLQTTIDWTQSEREIVYKILSAMGITVEQRRNWLARLKKELMERSTKQKLTTKAKQHLDRTEDLSNNSSDNYEISPAIFLHILRDLHVQLTAEEEAVLLDCLDTERIARIQAKKLTSKLSKKKSGSRKELGTGNQGEFALPSIDYASFVTFCGRHCGSWMDSSPALYEIVHKSIQSIHYPLLALQEFMLLCKSFDELNTGYISNRAFVICCNRSTLFTGLSEQQINELSSNLSVEGAGEIEYSIFCLQLRGVCASIQQSDGIDQTIHSSSLSILSQLIKNAGQSSSTLLPLRKWLLMHSDIQSLIITMKEFNALLREFSVIYRPEDLDLLYMEIGYDVDQEFNSLHSSNKLIQTLDEYDTMKYSKGNTRIKVVSTKKFIEVLNTHRESWVARNPVLARKMLKAMQSFPLEEGVDDHQHHNSRVITKIIQRLEAFSISMHDQGESEDRAGSIVPSNNSNINNGMSNMHMLAFQTKNPSNSYTKLIETDVFDYLLRSMGIHLVKEDILFLADSSDPHPEANYINIYLLFDLLKANANNDEDDFSGDLSDAARYALNHLQDLVWKAMSQTTSLKITVNHVSRTALEWINDVKCIFHGFDVYNNGLISLQDFVLALHCLNIKMSIDMIKDMHPYVGLTSSGPVQYKRILAYILSTPISNPNTKINNHLDNLGDRQMKIKALKSTKDLTNGKKSSPTSSVSKLLHAVRRNICINHLILSNQHLEEAWMEMLQVFHAFDPHESNRVSARDFCLAVSVLLSSKATKDQKKAEDVILTKAEWEHVIDYFTIQEKGSSLKPSTNTRGELLLVDYMLFCELVLDPKEVDARLKELQHNPDIRSMRMEYAKSNLLSKGPALSVSGKGRHTSHQTMKSSGRSSTSDMVAHARSLNSKFYGYDAETNSIRSSRPNSPHKRDEVADRFNKAQEKYKANIAFGRTYHGSEEDNTSYRVGNTQGQASRDHHSKLNQTTGGARDMRPLSHFSTQDLYESSHNRSPSKSRVRFNWTS